MEQHNLTTSIIIVRIVDEEASCCMRGEAPPLSEKCLPTKRIASCSTTLKDPIASSKSLLVRGTCSTAHSFQLSTMNWLKDSVSLSFVGVGCSRSTITKSVVVVIAKYQ
jgi:hypothetical protein